VITPVDPVLSIANLEVKLGRRAQRQVIVSGVSFDIAPGTTTALVGESGSGKTTIARTITRSYRPSGGTVTLDSQGIGDLRGSELAAARRKLQMIFQNPAASCDPYLTIAQTLLEGTNGGTKAERRTKAAGLLEDVGLSPEVLDHHPHQLSGGQLQRVAIARALMHDPSLIVADEPTASLDISIQAQIVNLLLRLQEEKDLAYLLVSHNLPVVRHLSDQVVVLRRGRVVERGPTTEVFDNPAHPYTAELIRAAEVDLTGGRTTSRYRPPAGMTSDVDEIEVSPGHWVSTDFVDPQLLGGSDPQTAVDGKGDTNAGLRQSNLWATLRRPVKLAAMAVLELAVVVILVNLLLFAVLRLAGNPAETLSPPGAGENVIAATSARLGLDSPLIVQLFDGLRGWVRLDFGSSFSVRGVDATSMATEALQTSLRIVLPALVVSLLLAVAIGVWTGLRPRGKASRAIIRFTYVGSGIPYFWLAAILVLVFAIQNPIFPPTGSVGVASVVLPVIALSVARVSTLARLVRGRVLDVVDDPLVAAARSRGIRSSGIVMRHVMPNTIVPLLGWISIQLELIIGGVLIIEPMFNFDGIGSLLIRSVGTGDFAVVQASITLIALLVAGTQIVVELLLKTIDPRLDQEAPH
jgi:ABC-type oligopeptide transport system ATPase subunit/ABC-type dipeptide/oligopeptide/nickel transport system permease component